MLWRTHVVMGLAAGYLVFGGEPQVVALAGLGALLPDIDHPGSRIGRAVPVVPSILRLTVGHRGVLHSLAAAGAVFLLAFSFFGREAGVALAAGYLAHLLGDVFTQSGLPLLWPLLFRVRLPLIKTGGLAERLVLFPVMAVSFAFTVVTDAAASLNGLIRGVLHWIT